ncbi:site-specific DNA-methyltransferase [Xanthomonas campestris pv. raphani]|uniref:DNA-methyltransferase n=1 Tax=Xanthomonas campestris TaxID=339 RepID=UPI002B22DA44|nr:site-specific DNA-methyltransferase [Xanthomonas campestris]MEA9885970.1 site-specific DNA-methyltransferase [Xanthomonas campestris pv. raphani]
MIHVGDCLSILPTLANASVQTCITSPPYYGLRDYGMASQIGLEETPAAYVARLVAVFEEVRRVLRDDGTLWLNLGDSYASKPNGSIGATALQGGLSPHVSVRQAHARRSSKVPEGLKHKDLVGIPWRVAFALQEAGWYLRQDIIWSKPNPMPESVGDRCTKAHEYLFLLSKSPRYYFDQGAIREQATGSAIKADGTRSRRDSFARAGAVAEHVLPGQQSAQHREARGLDAFDIDTRNKRSVWTVATKPFREAHFATFPEQLIEPCVLAGAPACGVVLDPFMGAGTTAVVAERLGRRWLGVELNPEYADIAQERLRGISAGLPLGDVA